MIEYLILITTGLLVGFLAGLFGIGGGLIIVPIITFIFIFFHQENPQNAYSIGITYSMISVIFTGALTTFFNIKNNNFRFSNIKYFILPIGLGSIIGGALIYVINFKFLKLFFIFYCIFSAVQLLYKLNLISFFYKINSYFICLMFGIISSLVGIGGGTLLVPFFENQKKNIRLSISSASALGVVIGFGTLSSFVVLKLFLNIDNDVNLQNILNFENYYLQIFLFLTLPSLFLIYFSTKLLLKINQEKLKTYFAFLLLLIALSGIASL